MVAAPLSIVRKTRKFAKIASGRKKHIMPTMRGHNEKLHRKPLWTCYILVSMCTIRNNAHMQGKCGNRIVAIAIGSSYRGAQYTASKINLQETPLLPPYISVQCIERRVRRSIGIIYTWHAYSVMRVVCVAFLAGRHASRLLHRVESLADLEGADGLEETRAVVRPGRVLVLKDLLAQLAVVIGARVADVRLHVGEVLEVVHLAVHLEHAHRLAAPLVLVRRELHARSAAELLLVRHPLNGRALVEEVGGLHRG